MRNNYNSSINYIMNQLARNRGAERNEPWEEWIDRINSDTVVDSSPARKAAEIIFETINNFHDVLLWGDFDCDGITATAIISEALSHWASVLSGHPFEGRIRTHIPNRLTEGHGIDPDMLEKIFKSEPGYEPSLLIVVDTGIEETEGIRRFLSMADNSFRNIVILDHHATTEERRVPLDWLDAHVFTHDMADDNPNKYLCGAGLAGLLHMELNALGASHNDGEGLEPLPVPYDLMALGTIADMVPLKGINRHIVREGLAEIRRGLRTGLSTLVGQTIPRNNLVRGLTPDDIAFNVAPKINASSRVGRVQNAYSLLLGTEAKTVKELTSKLLKYNDKRKEITTEIWNEADAQFREDPNFESLPACVVYKPNWHQGVVGIVANKFLDKYKKPAMVCCDKSGGIITGSARSIEAVNLVQLFDECKKNNLFEDYGGHAGAGGFRLPEGSDFNEFRRNMHPLVEKVYNHDNANDHVWDHDLVLPLGALSHELLQAHGELEPTGMEHPYPRYVSENLYASNVKILNGGHVRFDVGTMDSILRCSAIWFNPPVGYTLDGPFSILYELKQDNYRKQGALQLIVRNMRR